MNMSLELSNSLATMPTGQGPMKPASCLNWPRRRGLAGRSEPEPRSLPLAKYVGSPDSLNMRRTFPILGKQMAWLSPSPFRVTRVTWTRAALRAILIQTGIGELDRQIEAAASHAHGYAAVGELRERSRQHW